MPQQARQGVFLTVFLQNSHPKPVYAALELLSTSLSLVWGLCLTDWSIHLDVARTYFCLQHVSHAVLGRHVGSLSHVVALSWYFFCFAMCERINRVGLHTPETGSKWDFPKCSCHILQWAPGPIHHLSASVWLFIGQSSPGSSISRFIKQLLLLWFAPLCSAAMPGLGSSHSQGVT